MRRLPKAESTERRGGPAAACVSRPRQPPITHCMGMPRLALPLAATTPPSTGTMGVLLLRALALHQLLLGAPSQLPPVPLPLLPQPPASAAALPCDAAFARSVNATGLVSVLPFIASMDDATAVDAAVNMSSACQAGGVWLPNSGHGPAGPPHGGAQGYTFKHTVRLGSRVAVRGGGANGAQFVPGGMTTVSCPADGPCFHLGEGQAMRLEALQLVGRGIAVMVHTASVVQFESVAFIATTDVDGIDTSPAGCDGCNVRLGSNNAALVIVNSYWLWFSHCSFTFYPDYHANGTTTGPGEKGQRPSVILRGETPHPSTADSQTNTVYSLNFKHSVFSGGGVQYQQTEHGDQWPGFYSFEDSTFEVSCTPLLDLQAVPNATKDWRGGVLSSFVGLHSITISEVSWVDPPPSTNYLSRYPAIKPDTGGNAVGVVSVNCSVPDCGLDGLFVTSSSSSMGAAGGDAPAVRVFQADHATGITVNTGGMTAAPDVMDAANVPFGNWISRSAGGWLGVGTELGSNSSNMTAHGEGAASHALLFGLAGERNARIAMDYDGALRYGDGSGPFHTVHRGSVAHSVRWDPPSLAPGKSAKHAVEVAGVEVGDVVTVAHTSAGEHAVLWSAHVSAAGRVLVVALNADEDQVDLPLGMLRVVVGRFD